MNSKRSYLPGIKKAINYIECNLKKKLYLNEVAEEACLSGFHFHRLFTSITGYTPGDYIRKRRLSEAAKDLITSIKPIRDVAHEYCYLNQESFTRAFQNFFFISPRFYRNTGEMIGIMEKMNIGTTIIPNAGKEISKPTLITLPVRYFIGMKYSGTNTTADTFSLMYSFLQYKSEIKNQTGENFYGFDTYRFDKYGKKIFDFYIATPVTSLRDIPKGMTGVEIPQADYALVKYKGNSSHLYSGEESDSVYTYIYNTLLPQHGLHFRNGEFKLQSDNSYQAVESDYTKIIIPVNC